MTRYGVDPFDEAIYDSVQGYVDPETGRKGATALAKRLSRNLATFSKKADPFTDTHVMNGNDLRAIIRETKNHSIVEALATEFNLGIFILPEPENGTKKGILSAVLKAAIEGGEACKAIDDALSDDVVMADEAVRCAKELDDQINALLTLRKRLMDSVVDPDHLPDGISRITRAPKK